MPGTTRDSIEIPFERDGALHPDRHRRHPPPRQGVRGHREVLGGQDAAVDFDANVVVLLLDAQQDISEQDAHIAGFVLESGRALVVGVNKWDGLERPARPDQDGSRAQAEFPFAKFHFISALKSTGIGR
jgi:GTP-binding protein